MAKEGGNEAHRRDFLRRGAAAPWPEPVLGLLGAELLVVVVVIIIVEQRTTAGRQPTPSGGAWRHTFINQIGPRVDTLDGASVPAGTFPTLHAFFAFCGLLLTLDPNARVELALASEPELPNKDRDDLDASASPRCQMPRTGSRLRPPDVFLRFRRITNPKEPMPGAAFLAPLDLAAAQILDSRRLAAPMQYAVFSLPRSSRQRPPADGPAPVQPRSMPIGTGPFNRSSAPAQERVRTFWTALG